MMLNVRQMLSDQVLSWPGVTVQPHRFGGIEFLYKGTEIGHLHGDHLVDLLFPKPLRDHLVATGRAQPHHMYPNSGWVSVYITSGDDVAKAMELLRMKYESLAAKQT